MTTDEYRDDDADDFAPNPRASQAAAARARSALGPEADAPAVVRQYPLVAIGAGAVIALLIGMMSYQLGSGARPLQLPPPTDVSAQTFGIPHVTSPAARTATIAPDPTIIPDTPTAIPLGLPVSAPMVAPQTGRGPGLVEQPAPPAPTYLEVVGAQAKHSPRGGHCGPTGGDCALGVPPGLDVSAYIANVGKQAPHKVR